MPLYTVNKIATASDDALITATIVTAEGVIVVASKKPDEALEPELIASGTDLHAKIQSSGYEEGETLYL